MDLARRVALIKADSAALADVAETDLATPIRSCPEWVMADLVRHVVQVHRSWYRIVAERITEPAWDGSPLPADDELVGAFRAGAVRFADLLGATDPATGCWTWGPEQNAGFIQRFQVQEIALHRWDAEDAIGAAGPIAADGAADALGLFAEILPLVAARAPASFTVVATDIPLEVPMLHDPARPFAGVLHGTASDLLLVLWRRLPLRTVEAAGDTEAIRASVMAAEFD